jgi:rhamnogalacturonyl hydrolase YesR
MAREHFKALIHHQDADGMWHQVIDRPESYRELSSTCMIGWSLNHARRQGWLIDPAIQAAADSAWNAARLRIAADGQLIDVCTGTGKQPQLRDYYDREALLGKDPRGGAFALLLAVERITP